MSSQKMYSVNMNGSGSAMSLSQYAVMHVDTVIPPQYPNKSTTSTPYTGYYIPKDTINRDILKK
uniref:PBCV_basic_adap domain-containing protein n=1 Tax=Heterorhabditis bacteriophora TaxID=37862 RepID=A0A1I7XT40_HETBA